MGEYLAAASHNVGNRLQVIRALVGSQLDVGAGNAGGGASSMTGPSGYVSRGSGNIYGSVIGRGSSIGRSEYPAGGGRSAQIFGANSVAGYPDGQDGSSREFLVEAAGGKAKLNYEAIAEDGESDLLSFHVDPAEVEASRRSWTRVESGLLKQLGMHSLQGIDPPLVIPRQAAKEQDASLAEAAVARAPLARAAAAPAATAATPPDKAVLQAFKPAAASEAPSDDRSIRGSTTTVAEVSRIAGGTSPVAPIPVHLDGGEGEPTTPAELLAHLGIGYYAKAVEANGFTSLAAFAALDEAGLRKAGLITTRSRQAVIEKLQSMGIR